MRIRHLPWRPHGPKGEVSEMTCQAQEAMEPVLDVTGEAGL